MLEVALPAGMMPPIDRIVAAARKNEDEGFDAVWWADHLMGWHPDAVWTRDVTPLAETQANPHLYVDPMVMMGIVGRETTRLRVGVAVTDVVRRPAPVLAQTMLTLDHATQGRAILGLGSGERLNLTPYGLPFDAPVERLAEGIDVLRLLWNAGGPVDYEGRFARLRRAVLGLSPYRGVPPPIWVAAHGKRMLELTGAKADGWLPTKHPVDEYAAKLDAVQKAAADAGRDPGEITPAMLSYVVVAPDEATLDELIGRPLVRALCVLLPAEVFRSLGVEPPLARAGSGFHDFIPTAVDRDRALRIIDSIPPRVVRHWAIAGTPERIVEQIRPYVAAGLRHLVLWNITPFAEPSLTRFSFRALAEVRRALA